MCLSAADLLDKDLAMVLSLEMAWMETTRTLDFSLGVNSLFGIFVVSLWLIILVPVIGR
jgi:hypothetical protein